MILKRCHIDRFGKLSDFDLTFSPELTVLLQENGFGKSTMAAFLKAMFYGLQKEGNSLEKNERKRFEPWQGGKFGGSLEFAVGDTDYLVTRTFGKTAAKDTFSLWDLTKGTKSTDYSEHLGEELFRLDAKSFARSTYLSQFLDGDPSATTSIQAKLSNLVEDTNDLLNFDTAMKALKEARKQLGVTLKLGTPVPSTREALQENQARLSDAQGLMPQLETICKQIDEENAGVQQDSQALQQLRRQIQQAAQREKQALLRQQYQTLQEKIADTQAALSRLDAQHPKGYPDLETVDAQKQTAQKLTQAKAHLTSLSRPQSSDAALAGRRRFPDPGQTARELEQAQEHCTLLAELTAQKAAQWLPQEARQLEDLNRRFPEGIPSRETRAQIAQNLRSIQDLEIKRDAAALTEEDRLRLSALESRFALGIPTEAELAAQEQAQEDLRSLRQELDRCALSQEEQQTYQALRRVFAPGVPAEEDIQAQRQACYRIAQLEAIKSKQTALVEQTPSKKRTAPLLVGGLLALVGLALLLLHQPIPGAAVLAAGAAALLWSLVPRGQGPRVVTASAITQEENQEFYDRKRALADFLLQFYGDAQDPETKLDRLLRDREQYLRLQDTQARNAEHQAALQKRLAEKNQQLQAFFARYNPGQPVTPGFVPALRQQAEELTRLRQRQISSQARQQALEAQAEALRRQTAALLSRYGQTEGNLSESCAALEQLCAQWDQLTQKQAEVNRHTAELLAKAQAPEQALQALLARYDAFAPGLPYADQVASLRRQMDAFQKADAELRQYEAAVNEDTRVIQSAEATLTAFWRTWGLAEGEFWAALTQMEADIRTHQALESALQERTRELQAFLAQHPAPQSGPLEPLPDLEALTRQESQLQTRLEEAGKRLSALRENRNRLQRTIDEIPTLEDQIEALTAAGSEALRKYALLSDAMSFLETARDNLATSYVGTVKNRFTAYADTLLPDQLEGVLLDKDLTLHIDAQGQPREVAAFSAGTMDCLMLCMRLALVDALFPAEKPCLILDDPFVNLDDGHTKKALEILKEISKGRQVIYLVCSSSRSV